MRVPAVPESQRLPPGGGAGQTLVFFNFLIVRHCMPNTKPQEGRGTSNGVCGEILLTRVANTRPKAKKKATCSSSTKMRVPAVPESQRPPPGGGAGQTLVCTVCGSCVFCT